MQEPMLHSSDTAHIALGIHDPTGSYSRHAGAMLASLFIHSTGPVCAHIVHNGTLTAENKQKLVMIAQRFQKNLRFYPVQLPTEYHALSGHVTQGALFRLMLPDLVEVSKIIYFDCDIVVTLDIFELWNLDMQEKPIAAILDPGMPTFPDFIRQRIQATGVSVRNYFNSGVLVMDIDCLRTNYQLFNQAIAYLQRFPESVFHDQDALNFLFQQNYLQLDSRYNKIVCRSRPEDFQQKAIWHFAGGKPWENYSSEMDMLYWKAVALTPWQNQLFDRLAAAISRSLGMLDEQYRKEKLAYEAQTTRLTVQKQQAGKRWVTLFPETENVHLTKDVGMIPYVMHRHYGYDSTLVCYPIGEYPALENEVNGLKLAFLDQSFPDSLQAGCEYIKKQAKNIDVLHVFHISIRSFQWISLYKSLNPQGKVYLKLDAYDIILRLKLTDPILDSLRLCDLISIESKELHKRLTALWPVGVEYLPNGIYDFYEAKPVEWEEKEDIICTVGRIGTKPKATEVLLDAFAAVASLIPDWTLKLIGPVEPDFSAHIRKFYDKHPQLADRVIFTGAIANKQLLDYEYRRAKVFCLPSVFESFGIVLVEAIKNGCFVISSNVGAASDITDNGTYGELFGIGNTEQLSKLLLDNCNNPAKLKWVCEKVPKFARQHFHWVDICKRIDFSLQIK